jgi:probable rRNA maturation factor
MNSAQTYPFEIAVIRNDDHWPEGLDERAETAVWEAFAFAKPKIKGPAELSIVLTNDAEQGDLNRQWRGKNSSTNVLSFPQIEPFAPVFGLLGDITLARETVEREALDLGKPFEDHFTHLVVHGVLHILGYDHIDNDQALEMEGLETRILAALGIDDPYAGSDPAS